MHHDTRRITRRRAIVSSGLALATSTLHGSANESNGRKVAITIDDGPVAGGARQYDPLRGATDFVRVSKALRESFVAERVPVTMFVNEWQLNVPGQRDARVRVLEQWLDAGLDLGNHTYSHRRLGRVPLAEFLDDIIKGEVITRRLLENRGQKLVWFRYPFLASGKGEEARAVEEFLAQRGYRIAPVSVDYKDYQHNSTYMRHVRAGQQRQADEQMAGVLKALDAAFDYSERQSKKMLGYEVQQVLLIHCNEMNSLILRQSIQRIRDRGYEFVTLDEAMTEPAYNLSGIRPGGLGGGGLFRSLAAAKDAG